MFKLVWTLTDGTLDTFETVSESMVAALATVLYIASWHDAEVFALEITII